MRVLMISADRGLFGKGSSGDVAERHQKYANEAGRLDVVVFAGGEYVPVEHSGNFRVFPSRSGKLTHWRGAAQEAFRLAAEADYDLVHAQDVAAPVGERVKRRLGVPFTVSVHSMFFSGAWLRLNPLNWYLLWRLKRAMRAADGFRVNTEIIAAKIKQWFPGAPVLVQPTPADISAFFVDKKPRNNSPVILYVGRLSPEKNVEMLIRAISGLTTDQWSDHWKLRIVGEGPEKKNLEQLTSKLQLDERVRFVGPKPHSELPAIYKSADIFALPSSTESFGKVLLEAAAAKCAIVATETAGASSILTNEKDALLTSVGDKEAFKKALGRLVNDVDRQKRLGEQAHKTARQYDAQKGIKRTVDFWRQIAQK